MKKIVLARKTIDIIKKALRLDDLGGVIDREYPDIRGAHDIDRAKAQMFSGRYRGSVRLNSSRYYTADETKERIKKVEALKLP